LGVVNSQFYEYILFFQPIVENMVVAVNGWLVKQKTE
jgi:hypothetical protein